MRLRPSDTREARHRVSDLDPRSDYLDGVWRARALLLGLGFSTAINVAVIVGSGFVRSRADGLSQLWIFELIFGAALVLCCAVALGPWIPAAVRAIALRRRMPSASFYIVRLVPGFWGRLAYLDPDATIGSRLQDAVLSFDGESAVVWRGVIRPRRVAALPLANLSRIETDRPIGTPFRRRIVVLTFTLGEVTMELPLALRRIAGFGFWRLSPSSQGEVVRRLSNDSASLEPAAASVRD